MILFPFYCFYILRLMPCPVFEMYSKPQFSFCVLPHMLLKHLHTPPNAEIFPPYLEFRWHFCGSLSKQTTVKVTLHDLHVRSNMRYGFIWTALSRMLLNTLGQTLRTGEGRRSGSSSSQLRSQPACPCWLTWKCMFSQSLLLFSACARHYWDKHR